MADGALLLICCYAGLLWREIWICCESPPFNKTKLVKEIGSMVKALSARVFIRVFEVCWSLVLIPPNGGSRDHRPVCIYSPHIASRFPFCLWLCSFRFCDSAAHLLVCRAPFPRLLCRKALATVVGVSLPSEETVNIAFLQFRGLSLFDSSGVFYLFKEV
uniref:STAS domain-containing protein n=1 Tax=Fagus sylvatica TaxID=28930 RepID=A0A2N9IG10_FAGSY